MYVKRMAFLCSFFFVFLSRVDAQVTSPSQGEIKEMKLNFSSMQEQSDSSKLLLTISGFNKDKHQISMHRSNGEFVKKIEDREVIINSYDEGSYLLVLECFESYSVISTKALKPF